MKKLLFFIFILLLLSQAKAQDSLSKVLDDSQKIELLLKMAENHKERITQRIIYAEQALRLSQQNNLKEKEVAAFTSLARLYYKAKDFVKQFESLEKKWNLVSRQEVIYRTMFLALFHGIFLAMGLYNLLIFFVTKDFAFLYYSLSIFFMSIHLSFIDDLFLISSGLPAMNNHILTSYSSFFACFCFLQYTRYYFNAKDLFPIWNRILNYYSLGYIIIVLLYVAYFNLLLGEWVILLSNIQDVTLFILILFLGWDAFKLKYKPAIYFFAANIILFVTALVYIVYNTLVRFDFIEPNRYVLFIFSVGIISQIILYSYALAARINILRREVEQKKLGQERIEKEKALEINALMEEQNRELERKVKERTRDLQEANEELNQTLTELKQAEAQLVQAEKMASLGQLTAGIAHEINNPINFITANIDSLKANVEDIRAVLNQVDQLNENNYEQKLKEITQLKENFNFEAAIEELEPLMKGIAEGADRTAEIIKGLRTFSRLDEDVLKKTNLHENLDSTLILLHNRYKNRIEIIKEYGDIPLIEAYPGKLNQVFMNILSNAIDAVEGEGKIWIKSKPPITPGGGTDSLPFGEGWGGASSPSRGRRASVVQLSIKDSGCGMTEETQKHLFEPFFTTKEVGKGVGLGLSIVYSIIEKHQGTIEVESKLGEGTTFCITLPIIQNQE